MPASLPEEKPSLAVASSPFLMGFGARFSPGVPGAGFFLDTRSGRVLKSPGGTVVMETEHSGIWAGKFPFLTTHVGEMAGKRPFWNRVPGAGVLRIAGELRRAAGRAGASMSDEEALDLKRFLLQVDALRLVDLGSLNFGQFRSQLPDSRAGRGGILMFLPGPSRGEAARKILAGGKFEFSVGMEGAAGNLGSWARKLGDGPPPPFYIDRGSGTMKDASGKVVGVGFPQSKAGGCFRHVDWGVHPGVNPGVYRQSPQPSREMRDGGRNGIVVASGGLDPASLAKALTEAKMAECHHLGPKSTGVLRANGRILAGGWGMWLSSPGTLVGRGGREEWSEAKRRELGRLREMAAAFGAGRWNDGFSKLEWQLAGGKKTGFSRGGGAEVPREGSGRGSRAP